MQLNNQIDFLKNVNDVFNTLTNTIKLDMNIDLNKPLNYNQLDSNEVESYLSKYDNIIISKDII